MSRDLWLVEKLMPVSLLPEEQPENGPSHFCFVFADRKAAVKWAAGKHRVSRVIVPPTKENP